jgi:hypothetical protein
MVMGMIFSVMTKPPNLVMFYGHLAGALVVVAYYTYSGRKKRQNEKKRK